jgi:hypothetical protein
MHSHNGVLRRRPSNSSSTKEIIGSGLRYPEKLRRIIHEAIKADNQLSHLFSLTATRLSDHIKMRLLHSQTLKLEESNDLTRKPYAILSHTWGEGEVSFQEMQSGEGREKAGYSKIRGCCKAAAEDGFEYVWIDTCCIDKTSSSELSEAINSMYKWYQEAEVCYVYLADVFSQILTSSFAKSRWFTRGWTLQELIAPSSVIFFDAYWRDIGTKASLVKPIAETTGIHIDALRNTKVSRFSVAQRMSWASRRETTREEDIAYCLLGIFSINMPLLYGEGKKAFLRLQEEVMKKSDDHSIFAWVLPWSETSAYRFSRGFIAQTPLAFANASTIVRSKYTDTLPFTITNRGIHLQLPLKALRSFGGSSGTIFLAALDCKYEKKDEFLAIQVYKNVDGRYSRYHTATFQADKEMPTISFREREKMDKVSLYTAEDEEENTGGFFNSRYAPFEIDRTGVDIKHTSFSNVAYNDRVQHHNGGTILLESPFYGPFGILKFNVEGKSGDGFFVALASGARQTTPAAFVDTIHPRETLVEVFDFLKNTSDLETGRVLQDTPLISSPSLIPSYGRYRNKIPTFTDRINWQCPGKPWSVNVAIKRKIVSGKRIMVVYIETKDNVPVAPFNSISQPASLLRPPQDDHYFLS